MRLAKWGKLGIAAVFVATILISCGSGGGMPIATEPDPKPLPTLTGTWHRTTTWTSSRGVVWRSDFLLTFVGGRAIRIITSHNETTGEVRNGSLASGWEATESTVARLWYEDHSDDQQDNPEHGSVDKTYHWGNDERSVLFVHEWRFLSPADSYDRWERVSADTLPSPVGSWRFEHDHDDLYELTIGVDGRFELKRTRPTFTWTLTGTGTLDLENYLVDLVDLEEMETDAEGNLVNAGPWRSGAGRAAFVPSVRGIVVSPPWHEQDAEIPYGEYDLFFERAQ